jgi:uncharacterized membrane protein YgcG
VHLLSVLQEHIVVGSESLLVYFQDLFVLLRFLFTFFVFWVNIQRYRGSGGYGGGGGGGGAGGGGGEYLFTVQSTFLSVPSIHFDHEL